jgi:hypothetical protein
MPKISSYTTVAPSLYDKLIGTDANDNLSTKNFTVGSISDLIQKTTLSLSLDASSTDSTIEPTALDTLTGINFGVAQANLDVSLSGSGRVVFNTDSWYNVEYNAAMFGDLGRITDRSVLFLVTYKNGVMLELPSGYSIPLNGTEKNIMNHSQTFLFEAVAGDYLEFFILRDSSGINAGGLSSVRASGSGPLSGSDSPASSISIHKIN